MPAMRVCPTSGCPELTAGGRCEDCRAEAERKRGTAAQRGYAGPGHRRFRKAVLERDPICVLCHIAPSKHADHHPVSRKDLVLSGLDPNNSAHGRGLCASCHATETAAHQPGGWNQ